jgi:hypothetical protein
MKCKTQSATSAAPTNGELVTLEFNGLRVSGRLFSVAGVEWLLQPGRLIRLNIPYRIIEGRIA